MKTKEQFIEQLKKEYPTIKIGSEEVGYDYLSAIEYNQTISDWADIELQKQEQIFKEQQKIEAKAAAEAKLAALGLTADDLKALGL